jgi:hypothetical protein
MSALQHPSLLEAINTVEDIGKRARSMARNAIGTDRDYSLCDLLQELDDLNRSVGELRRAMTGERAP